MSELYNTIPLSETTKFIVDNRGKTAPTEAIGIKLIATNCVNNSNLYPIYENLRYISQETYDHWFRAHPKPDDILITLKGSQNGAICLVPDPVDFVIAQDMVALRANEKIIDRLFLFAALRSPDVQSQIINLDVSGVIPHLKKTDFDKLLLPYPSRPIQEVIGKIYFNLSKKIDLLHRQNKTLESLVETLFRQLFVEEAQEDWEEIPFEQFFDFLEGPGIRNWQYTDTGTPFINIRLITSNGDIDVSKANFVSDEEANVKYSHFHLKEGDMIVSTSGTLGKSAIVRCYHLPLLLNTSVIRFRPKDGRSYSFVYQYLNSRLFQEHLESTASGSVQANFGPTHLKQMTLSKPPKNILDQYLLQADKFYEKLKVNQSQIRTLEKLRDSLLPKLMSGEVRVAV